MGERENRYWQCLAQQQGDPAFRKANEDEFAEELPVGPGAAPPEGAATLVTIGKKPAAEMSRRTFFQLMGVSAASAGAAACRRAPVGKIIPFLNKPAELTPGVPLWYASTCDACSAHCGLLLKTRDGRPIKVEGNDSHPWSEGGVCAMGQASVLSVYDSDRLRGPMAGGRSVDWRALDDGVRRGLAAADRAGKAIRVVVPSVVGPTAETALDRFLVAYPTARIVRYDPLGQSSIGAAHQATHGVQAIPALHFDRARVVVGVCADFLGTWISPVAYTRQYTRARDAAHFRRMLRHYQLEPTLTLTGSNADQRFTILQSDAVPILAALARRILRERSHPAQATIREALDLVPQPVSATAEALDAIATDLLRYPRETLVVYGQTDPGAHALANTINELLGNYDVTVELDAGVYLDPDAARFDELLDELRSGKVGAVLFVGVNPGYSHPLAEELAGLLKKVDLTVATSDRVDETARLVQYVAPDHHFLESWGDAEPRRGLLSIRQPAITPLFDTRGAYESLLRWAGFDQTYYDYMRERWRVEILATRGILAPFTEFWDKSVQQGFVFLPDVLANPATMPDTVAGGAAASQAAASQIAASQPASQPDRGVYRAEAIGPLLADRIKRTDRAPGIELVIFPKLGIRDGSMANNAWLQELPDPITKLTWTNVALMSAELAGRLGVRDGAIVEVAVGDRAVRLPTFIQPGIHDGVVAIAMGYGRTGAGRQGNGVGANAYPLAASDGSWLRLTRRGVTVRPTGAFKELALSQTYSSEEGRPLVREATVTEILRDPAAGQDRTERNDSMWSGHEYPEHRWAMAIDLNACTGCSACVVSCQAENNVPVVGEDEVRRRREMSWLRIDRYYAGPPGDPRTVHQPMMCQHCENAPCETVCPVLATVHSSEGLNQQIYNRCVGTRYCANNCPYKVRRFNWFDYKHDDELANMVLNPDVVVRSRGVMEKCSMCVQRIMAGKDTAKAEHRKLRDGDIRTACQQSCPAQAIVFGDVNDATSRIAQLVKDGRSYRVLSELNVGPSIVYMTKVRNPGGAA